LTNFDEILHTYIGSPDPRGCSKINFKQSKMADGGLFEKAIALQPFDRF